MQRRLDLAVIVLVCMDVLVGMQVEQERLDHHRNDSRWLDPLSHIDVVERGEVQSVEADDGPCVRKLLEHRAELSSKELFDENDGWCAAVGSETLDYAEREISEPRRACRLLPGD